MKKRVLLQIDSIKIRKIKEFHALYDQAIRSFHEISVISRNLHAEALFTEDNIQ